MPEMPCSRSPDRPVRSAGKTGPLLPQTRQTQAGIGAIRQLQQVGAVTRESVGLLAVTTDLPASSALRTNSSAGVRPPISSIHDVCVGGEDLAEIFGPNYIRRDPGLFLAFHVPVADVVRRSEGLSSPRTKS